jgi:hypothetical protein
VKINWSRKNFFGKNLFEKDLENIFGKRLCGGAVFTRGQRRQYKEPEFEKERGEKTG